MGNSNDMKRIFFMFYNQMISVIVYDLMIHFIVDMGDKF